MLKKCCFLVFMVSACCFAEASNTNIHVRYFLVGNANKIFLKMDFNALESFRDSLIFPVEINNQSTNDITLNSVWDSMIFAFYDTSYKITFIDFSHELHYPDVVLSKTKADFSVSLKFENSNDMTMFVFKLETFRILLNDGAMHGKLGEIKKELFKQTDFQFKGKYNIYQADVTIPLNLSVDIFTNK